MDEKRLMVIKGKVETIKTELAIKESKYEDLLDKIKEEYGIQSIEEINKRLTEIEKSLENLSARKESLSEKIERKLVEYEL